MGANQFSYPRNSSFVFCLSLLWGLAAAWEAAGAERPYATKPPWWDEVKVEIPDGDSPWQQYQRFMAAQQERYVLLSRLWALGLFDDNDGKPFEHVYPPEKEETLVPDKGYAGKEGKTIRWQRWDPRSEDPPPFGAEFTNAVVFFHTVISSKKEKQAFLLVASDDGCQVWLNGEEVHRNVVMRGINLEHPDRVPITLQAGENRLLVKLHQGGEDWGIRLWLADFDLHLERIKLLTQVHRRNPEKDAAAIMGEIVAGYREIGEMANYFFWLERLIAVQEQRQQRDRMRSLREYVDAAKPDVFLSMSSMLTRLILDNKIDTEARKELALWKLDKLVEVEGRLAALEYAKTREFTLGELIGRNHLLGWRIRLNCSVGDLHLAEEDLARLEQLEESNLSRQVRREVSSLRSAITSIGIPQLPIDWGLGMFAAEVGKHAAEDGGKGIAREAIGRLVRNAGQLAPTETSEAEGLHPGALSASRDILKPVEEAVRAAAERYVNTAVRLGQRSRQIEKISSILLGSPLDTHPRPAGDPPDIFSPMPESELTEREFTSLCQFIPGRLERLNELDHRKNLLRRAPPCEVHDFGEFALAANSWGMAKIDDHGISWQRLFSDNLRMPNLSDVAAPKMRLKPLFVGGAIVARFVNLDSFTLRGIDPENGNVLWNHDTTWKAISNPVQWGEQIIVVGKKRETPPAYSLRLINPLNGRIEDELTLFSADDTISLGWNMASNIDLDHVADPVIAGNTAYIASNHGVVFAVNLVEWSFQWGRLYQRAPLRAIERLARAAIKRYPFVIVGNDKVLFSPIDAIEPLLLERESGTLISNTNDRIWLDAMPLGKNSFIAVSDRGSAVIASLEDLRVDKTLAGSGFRLIQQLEDGVAVANEDTLFAVDSDGGITRELAIPEGFVPQALAAAGVLGFQHQARNALGILADRDNFRSLALPDNYAITYEDPRFQIMGENDWITDSNALIRLNPETLSPRWRFPFIDSYSWNDRPKAFVVGNYAYVVTRRQIAVIDDRTGLQLAAFPEYGEEHGHIHYSTAELIKDKVIFFFTPASGDRQLLSMKTGTSQLEIEQIGSIPRSPNPRAIFGDGSLIMATANSDRKIEFYRAANDNLSYEKLDKDIDVDTRHRNIVFYTRVSPEAAVMLRDYREAAYRVSDKMDLKTVSWGEWEHHHHWRWKTPFKFFSPDLIAMQFHQLNANVVDFYSGTNLSEIFPFEGFPVLLDNKLLGNSVESGNRMKFAAISLSNGKIILEKEVEVPNNQLRQTLSFALDNKAYHLFHLNRQDLNRSTESIIASQSLDAKEVEIAYFPGVGRRVSDILIHNDRVGLIVRDRFISMSTREFLDFTKTSPLLFECKWGEDDKVGFSVDGFLDEWPDEVFHERNGHRFAVRLDGDNINIALTLNEMEIIKQVAGYGLTDRWRLAVMPGSTASFSPSDISSSGISIPLGDSLPDEIEFDFFIPPSGDALHLELQVPTRRAIKFDPRDMKNTATRDIRGDIAFELIIPGKDDVDTGLLSGTDIPAFFPRILLDLE